MGRHRATDFGGVVRIVKIVHFVRISRISQIVGFWITINRSA